ncbi:unnamed protein product [Miscanthus lutarioriparius]|uniref:Uncharacterized protein n=1 Tax=Miscanthus lutarioriparius TaxID=422564 RepID=A0A811RSB1_9POAL|nr:unnamed protein product [Miscanthus lutarioriparius]
MAADWWWARRAWEKWAAKHVGPSGKPVQAALLLNYDPSGPSRLLPVVAEQERTQLSALDMHPFLDFVKRGNLQTEFFSVGPNQSYDANAISTDSLLLRSKSASDGLYESLVIGLNVVMRCNSIVEQSNGRNSSVEGA